jgi:aerobic carbon-monoxide dehydrogenase large subunit
VSPLVGTPVTRLEDDRLLRGRGVYVDDVPLEGAAWATFVRSPHAFARVISVDASALPSTGQAFAARDVPLPPFFIDPPDVDNRMARPPLAGEYVRFVGDIVAVAVDESRGASLDAAELVDVDYEPLAALVDLEDALRDTTLLFPEVGTNVCARISGGTDGPDPFAACDVVVRHRQVSQRIASCPMEARAAAATWDGEALTLWASTQTPHLSRDLLAKAVGLEPENVRVIAPDVGGGFGPKILIGVEEILVAWLARELGRPVRWAESRTENMVSQAHGRAQAQDIRIGGTSDGRILALELSALQDAGAYPEDGAVLPGNTRMMASGVYTIPYVRYDAVSVVTNTVPTTSLRGAGRPEAAQAIERAVDVFAAELGLDPADVRRHNLIPRSAFPYRTPTGAVYDTGDYAAALDRVLEAAAYDALRAEQEARRARDDVRQLGVGLALYVEVTNPPGAPEFGAVEIGIDGRARVLSGIATQGQGHATAFAMIVADRLGLPIEMIDVVQGDTALIPRGIGTFGSRSLHIGGSAILAAADRVLEEARRRVAVRLEAAPDDVVRDHRTGRFHIAGSLEPSLAWGDLARSQDAPLRADVDFRPSGQTFPFGAHLAVVEIDRETGAVELLRLLAVDDCGPVVNPLLARGQRYGGIAQGLAQALFEVCEYDAAGAPVNIDFETYMIPSAADFPAFELLDMETPTTLNELGIKGIGESGTIGATPAVWNAIVDGLAPLGVRHIELPATAARIRAAVGRVTP